MRDIILLGVGGYIGWYLATEEKEATLRTLKEVKQKATNLGIQLKEESEKNEKLNKLLDGFELRKGFDGKR